jgi:hypothetical protein
VARNIWTDLHIDLLKEMWAHDFSASEIAATLGIPFTRNAVISKATMLKFPRRTSHLHYSETVTAKIQNYRKQWPLMKIDPPKPNFFDPDLCSLMRARMR